MKNYETEENNQIFGDISQKLSAVKTEIEISPELQAEYISFHKSIDPDKYEEDEIIKERVKLSREGISDKDKKRILFILAHIGTLPCVKIIEGYMDKTFGEMKAWAILAFEEAWMFLESDSMGINQANIFSGAGGDGERMRHYFVISSKNDFTEGQKDLIKNKFEGAAGKLDSEIEKMDFGENYALVSALVSMDAAVGNLIEAGVKACNAESKFLRSKYFVTNVKKPSRAEIEKYLNELKWKIF